MPNRAVIIACIALAVLAVGIGLPEASVYASHELDHTTDHPGGPVSGGMLGVTGGPLGTTGGSPGNYLSNIYLWFIGFVGIAALFMIVAGGITYMFSGTNLTKVEQGRQWITNAIWGIVLAAFAVLLLRTINPDLIRGFNFDQIINRAVTRPTAPTTPVPDF